MISSEMNFSMHKTGQARHSSLTSLVQAPSPEGGLHLGHTVQAQMQMRGRITHSSNRRCMMPLTQADFAEQLERHVGFDNREG